MVETSGMSTDLKRRENMFKKGALTALGVLVFASPAMAFDKEDLGGAVGAGLGGFLGSQVGNGEGQLIATALGVFLGNQVGQHFGQSLDRADTVYANRYQQRYQPVPAYATYPAYEPTYVAPPALPPQQVIVQRVNYNNYDNDYRPRRHAPATYCREFTQQVRIGQRIQESYGTACLQPDGSWQIIQ
jgi:surface antigen